MEEKKEHDKEHNKEHHAIEHHKEEKMLFGRPFYKKVYVILGIALILFGIYNISQITSFSRLFSTKLAEAKEAARPAQIELITIKDANCKDCFDITPVVSSIKKYNVNITKEENLDLNSEKAEELINEYGIEKIPAVLLFGEIDRNRISELEERKDSLLFTNLLPPYTDAKSKKTMGKVSAIILKDTSCEKCIDLSKLLSDIKKLGVNIVSERSLNKEDEYSQELIKKYSIDKLPTLILSDDLKVYSQDINARINQVGSIEDDGFYVLRLINPPYLNLSSNKIIGLVSMTVITDKSCNECYDPNKFHKPILQRMGVVFEKEDKADISSPEGKALLSKYSIDKVPTIILEGDVEAYPVLVNAWTDVGTKESDGMYVFRKVEVAQQAYKDLSKGEIVSPKAAAASSQNS